MIPENPYLCLVPMHYQEEMEVISGLSKKISEFFPEYLSFHTPVVSVPQ